MSVWKLALLAVLLFGVVAPHERWNRVRVAAAMMAGSFAAMLAVYALPSDWVLWSYLAIDLGAAFIILMHPRTVWQRFIGLCYVGMAMLTLGFALTLQFLLSAVGDPNMLKVGHDAFSWAALALLLLWGADGFLRLVSHRRGNDVNSLAVERVDIRR
jgi:hypothetical protein